MKKLFGSGLTLILLVTTFMMTLSGSIFAASPITFPDNYEICVVNKLYNGFLAESKKGGGNTFTVAYSDDQMIKNLPLEDFNAKSDTYLTDINEILGMSIPFTNFSSAYSVKYNKGNNFIKSLETKIEGHDLDKYFAVQPKVNSIANEIMKKADTDRQRVTLLNRYLIENVEYDTTMGAGLPENDKRIWESWGALDDGKAVCSGYANAFSQICKAMDIPVMTVSGYRDRKSPNDKNEIGHEWNEVFIENKWYGVDVTSNDPVITGGVIGQADKTAKYGDKFLLVDKAYLKSNKYEWDEKALAVAKEMVYPNVVEDKADALKAAGMFSGDGAGYRLSDKLNRAEMAIMLSRVANGTAEIKNNREKYEAMCTFTDVPSWAKAEVGYCKDKDLVNGIGDGLYGSMNTAGKKDFCTVALRAKGIKDGYDFNTAIDKAIKLGYLSGIRGLSPELNRADVVAITYNMMGL